jgi:hypothetical protein
VGVPGRLIQAARLLRMSEVTGYSTEGWNGPLVLAGGAGGSLQWPHILWGLSVIFESILDLEEKDGAPLLTDPWKRPRFTPWRAVGGTKFVTGRMRLVMDDGKTIEYGPVTSLTCRQVTAKPVSVVDGMGGHDQMLAAVFRTKRVAQSTHASVVDARPLPSEQRCDMGPRRTSI